MVARNPADDIRPLACLMNPLRIAFRNWALPLNGKLLVGGPPARLWQVTGVPLGSGHRIDCKSCDTGLAAQVPAYRGLRCCTTTAGSGKLRRLVPNGLSPQPARCPRS